MLGGKGGPGLLDVGVPVERVGGVGGRGVEDAAVFLAPARREDVQAVGVDPEVVGFGITVEMQPNSIANHLVDA